MSGKLFDPPSKAMWPWNPEYFIAGVIVIFLFLAVLAVSAIIWPPETTQQTNLQTTPQKQELNQ